MPAESSCPENEKWTCGPVCIETCDYKPEICTAICRFGCFCNDGYVRQSNATDSPCVSRESCKKPEPLYSCGKNQEYNDCGTSCPPTCDDFSYPLPKPLKRCTAACIAGCFCKEGFYRTDKNRCVPPEKCCNGENEVFNGCGTACPETCDYKPTACTRQCVQGCFCKSSNCIRKDNSTNSPCISRKECSKKLVY